MKHVVKTDKAPGAIGPYSQAIKTGGFVFTSGQIPLDPKTGELVDDSAENAAVRSLENLKAVLDEAGSSLDKVVKTLVLLADINDFGTVNEVYGRYFKENPPARSCFQVAALPKGAKLEIEAIAEI